MSYYCHSCQDAKQQSKIEHCADGLVCRDCRSDFLEELNEQHFPSLVFDQSSGSSSGRHHHQRHHPYAYSLFSSASSDRAGTEVSDSGAAGASSSSAGAGSEVYRLRLSRSGGGATGGGASGGASASVVGQGELDQLIQSLFQQVFGIVGDLDNYALGVESLDNVVTQLMNQLDGGGPPPATPDDMRRIQSVAVTEQQQSDKLQCSVCFDEFLLGCYVDQLPCQHCFHHNCIRPWLEKHGTCPVCRKRLSGEDTSTQSFADRRVPAAAATVSGASTRRSSVAVQTPPPPRRNLRRRIAAASVLPSGGTAGSTASRSRDRSGGDGSGSGGGGSGASSHRMEED
uniref:RING-type E3 ubiquitin transferase n=2 Tax=Macrostomum lignano TaxID=282301 RepID=A0A1I8G1K9_9PLAT